MSQEAVYRRRDASVCLRVEGFACLAKQSAAAAIIILRGPGRGAPAQLAFALSARKSRGSPEVTYPGSNFKGWGRGPFRRFGIASRSRRGAASIDLPAAQNNRPRRLELFCVAVAERLRRKGQLRCAQGNPAARRRSLTSRAILRVEDRVPGGGVTSPGRLGVPAH